MKESGSIVDGQYKEVINRFFGLYRELQKTTT